jgi:hypothetical protein
MAKRNMVVGINWNSLSINGQLLSRVEIQARHGIPFTEDRYQLLKTAFRICRRKYHKDAEKCGSLSAVSKRGLEILGKLLLELKKVIMLRIVGQCKHMDVQSGLEY